MSEVLEPQILESPRLNGVASTEQEHVETILDEFVHAGNLLQDASLHKSRAAHGPLPIVIGVTGHRDLREEDIPQLNAVLRNRYEELSSRYPATSFVLLSALADGADRLCARLALDLGLHLIAVLPMPQALYEQDFDEESLKEFRELLAASEHSFELPVLNNYTTEDLSFHGPMRDLQYEQLAAYLATQSQILLAFWDGVHKSLVGGTSEVVRFKLNGVPESYGPPRSDLDAPDSGGVVHIVTPRISNPTPVGAPYSVIRLSPPGFASDEDAQEAQRHVQKRIDMFNSDALRYSETLRSKMQQSKSYLFPTEMHKLLPEMMDEILDFYAIADVLSQRFQKRTHLTLKILLGFVFVAASFSQLYSGPIPETPMIVLFLTMFLLSTGVYFFAARRDYHVKYLDYRALAEGLRVQFYWKLAGLRDSVSDYYMRKQKSELDWIRISIRSSLTELRSSNRNTEFPKMSEQERMQNVLTYWVADQAKYFKKSAYRDQGQLRKFGRLSSSFYVIALAIAIVQAFLDQDNWITLAMSMFPVAAAILGAYNEKRAIGEQSKQFDRMAVLFNRAKNHLESLIHDNKLEKAKLFIAELGKEALTENGDWILTHRERPLEIPKGA